MRARDPRLGRDVAIKVLPTADTKPGIVLGTVGYLSPEQSRAKAADSRSDILAANLVLFAALAGTALYPFANRGNFR